MALTFNPFTGTLDFVNTTSGSSGNSFVIIQTDAGTFPVAATSADTLTLTSSDGSVVITGDSVTDTVDFTVDVNSIVGFSEAVDDRVDALIADGPGISTVYNDVGNSLTINNTGALTSFVTVSTPSGTSPVADLASDTLTLISSNSSLTISGDSATDTIDFLVNDEFIDDRVSNLLVEGSGIDLNYNDAGNLLTITNSAPATKHIFYVINTDANVGDFRVRSVGAAGNFRITFLVPHDFTSLVSIGLVGIPTAGAAGAARDIDIESDYATFGEIYNTNSETNTTITYNLTGTADRITSLDISSVFTGIAANDLCGFFFTHNAIGGTINYLGIVLRYN